jgi:hypothetical protein
MASRISSICLANETCICQVVSREQTDFGFGDKSKCGGLDGRNKNRPVQGSANQGLQKNNLSLKLVVDRMV